MMLWNHHCSRMLMRAYGSQVFDSKFKKNDLKLCPYSKWTLFKSTQKVLFKNVQDGISRPLGSREIQKTKVSNVLRDTLYSHWSTQTWRSTNACVPATDEAVVCTLIDPAMQGLTERCRTQIF